jgi:xylulokinase
MASRFAVGLDIGTSGCRAALYGSDGAPVANATRALRTLQLPDGGVEQDPNEIWSAVTNAIREVSDRARASGVEREAIVAIGCCSQYSSTIPVNARGLPVGNLILWMDKRGARYNQAIWQSQRQAIRHFVELHGLPPLPDGNDCLGHVLFLRHERPEQYAAAAAFVEAMDYLTARLTGRVTSTQQSAFMLPLIDNRTIGTCEYSTELVAFSGLDRGMLAPLVPVSEPVGVVLPEIAAELGLSAKTLVFPGLNDSQSAAMACGALQRDHAGLSIGTTSVLLAHVERKDSDLASSLVSMPSPLPGRYVVMAENGLGGRVLEHFLRAHVFADDALARHGAADPFAGLEAAVQSVAPGSDGVLFLPWLAGSMAPRHDPSMRGAFLNLSLGSTRAQLTRAVLEGIALNLRWLLDPVEAFVHRRLSHVVFGGGTARSLAFAQILADVLDRPIHRLVDPHLLNARASALYALARAGEAELEALASPSIADVHEPHPKHHVRYERSFTQLVAAFDANRPIFAALNQEQEP